MKVIPSSSPLYRWQNKGTEYLDSLLKVTQLQWQSKDSKSGSRFHALKCSARTPGEKVIKITTVKMTFYFKCTSMCKCYTKGDGGGWDPASICSFVFPYSEAPAYVASSHSQASFMISLLWTNSSIESLLSISEIRPRRPQEQVSGKLFRAPHRG